MIKLVSSIDAYHQARVSCAVKELQSERFEVKKIERKEKMFLGVFGEDVTHIFYEPI